MAEPLIKLNTVEHICVVVRDIDAAMKSMRDNFGIGPWHVNLRDPDSTGEATALTEMTYYGKPSRFGFYMAQTPEPVGTIKFELVQPTVGESIFHDFLRDHGEGVQHIGWIGVDTLEAFHQTIRRMEAAGFPCVTSARSHSAAFAFFDTTRVMNTVLEVLWRDATKKRPAPLRVFPA